MSEPERKERLWNVLDALAFLGGESTDGCASIAEINEALKQRGLEPLAEAEQRALIDSHYVTPVWLGSSGDAWPHWGLEPEGVRFMRSWEEERGLLAQASVPVRPGALSRPSALASRLAA